MIFFTSDNHFSHHNVIRYCNRPFKDIEEMNEIMVKNWNEVVMPDDIVIHLGDFSMSFTSVEKYSKRLNGYKSLVPGNHDFCHTYHKKSNKPEKWETWKEAYRREGWLILPEKTTFSQDGVGNWNMCHHPYDKDEYHDPGKPDKYVNWRPIDDGRILLCGHIHEKWKTNKSNKGTLMINVGVDVWDFKPISLNQILELISRIYP